MRLDIGPKPNCWKRRKTIKYIIDSVSDNKLSHEDENMISICGLSNSNSQNGESLAEELHRSSINKWEWDVNNSDCSTSCNYFDGHVFGNDKIIRPIDLFYKFISHDVIQLIIDQTSICGKQCYVPKLVHLLQTAPFF